MDKCMYYCTGSAKRKKGYWCSLSIKKEKDGFTLKEKHGNRDGNKMELELFSAYQAIVDAYKHGAEEVVIYTHSIYVTNGIGREWLKGWQESGWKTVQGDDIKNLDLWKKLYSLIYEKGLSVKIVYVKAEDSDPFIQHTYDVVYRFLEGA